MDYLARLQLVGRVTYYLGWIAALCGAFVHFQIATRMFAAINLTQRNLFEGSVLFFLICTASELRALVLARSQELPKIVKRQAA
jgi:Na+/proline symporter